MNLVSEITKGVSDYLNANNIKMLSKSSPLKVTFLVYVQDFNSQEIRQMTLDFKNRRIANERVIMPGIYGSISEISTSLKQF